MRALKGAKRDIDSRGTFVTWGPLVTKGVNVEFTESMTDQIWLRGRSKRRRVRQERWKEARW